MNLKIVTTTSLVPLFFRLLSGGFQVETRIGTNIPGLLCRQLKIPDDYLENFIQTVFLDGSPVDNLQEAIVTEGSVIALSAAMPGLVGATMRRGGYYASLRQSISYKPDPKNILPQNGKITLKFFNSILRDLGPIFLAQGVRITSRNLLRLINDIDELLKKNQSQVLSDESEIAWEDLLPLLQAENDVRLQVISETHKE
jgi:hypothetical protein